MKDNTIRESMEAQETKRDTTITRYNVATGEDERICEACFNFCPLNQLVIEDGLEDTCLTCIREMIW